MAQQKITSSCEPGTYMMLRYAAISMWLET